ncbi:hypothetical protein pb186bvf_018579 [Paramecium bursaria]
MIDTIELKEMRKTLHEFKKSGKPTLLSVLKILDEQKIDPTLIHDSKIHKTLLTLTKKDPSLEVDAEFNYEDLLDIKQKCINLYKKFKSTQGSDSQQNSARKQSATSQKSEQSEKKVVQPTHELSIDEMIKKLNLQENFEPQRMRVLRCLIEKLSENKQSRQIQQFQDIDFATLAKKLENETFMKHKMSQQYQNVIREMIKYISQDEDGSVRTRFLSNIITPSEAIQLKSEHWVTPKKIQASLSLSKEQIEAGDMGHARRIARSINQNSTLEKCPNCGELQLMLINEIQIRASDEPPARFFECIGCDHSEVRNG